MLREETDAREAGRRPTDVSPNVIGDFNALPWNSALRGFRRAGTFHGAELRFLRSERREEGAKQASAHLLLLEIQSRFGRTTLAEIQCLDNYGFMY